MLHEFACHSCPGPMLLCFILALGDVLLKQTQIFSFLTGIQERDLFSYILWTCIKMWCLELLQPCCDQEVTSLRRKANVVRMAEEKIERSGSLVVVLSRCINQPYKGSTSRLLLLLFTSFFIWNYKWSSYHYVTQLNCILNHLQLDAFWEIQLTTRLKDQLF